MLRVLASFVLACVVAALPATAVAAGAPALKSGVFDPPRMAPQIVMRDVHGRDFSLAQQRGKVVVLVFGYTACADVCPVSAAMLANARAKLGARADKLQVVFISVDPERDTPQALRQYLDHFDKSFIGLTGTPQQMAAIRTAYGISAKKHAFGTGRNDYVMSHSTYLYFIDPQGRLRGMLPFGRPAEDVVHDFNILVGQ